MVNDHRNVAEVVGDYDVEAIASHCLETGLEHWCVMIRPVVVQMTSIRQLLGGLTISTNGCRYPRQAAARLPTLRNLWVRWDVFIGRMPKTT